MSDLFNDDVPDHFIKSIFWTILSGPQHHTGRIIFS
ncbi:MAG: hypothetical protein GXP56_04610 [Deltaproteobacteria bacterium]|nr:hypothetical protein [Deltaproteobacteria bacterium]